MYQFAKQLFFYALRVIGLICFIGLIQGGPAMDMFTIVVRYFLGIFNMRQGWALLRKKLVEFRV